jgi:hypothetical protein
MPELDTAALTDAVDKALLCVILRECGNTDEDVVNTYADAMGEIVGMGPWAVHVALSGWCGVVLHGFEEAQRQEKGGLPAGGFWQLETVDRDGNTASIDQAVEPATRDALRIVACFGNKDHDTIAAIVKTAWDDSDETLTSLMSAAVYLAAQTARLHAGTQDTNDDD